MDRVILLLVGVAIVVALCLTWTGQPRKQQPQPRSAVLVDEADAVQILDLSTVPEDLGCAAGATMPRPSSEYPDAASSLLLYEPSPELGVAASKVLPQPIIAYSDSSIPYAVLEEPSPALFRVIPPKPSVSQPDTAVVFVLEQPLQGLISSTGQVRPRPVVEYANAGWIGSLSPPLGLLEKGE